MELEVLNKDNQAAKKIALRQELFGAPLRRQLIFDCVQGYLTNKRLGTSKVKSRGEVRGSTRKIYKQKGTGNARHGDRKANIFVGGGIAFGPKPREWHHRLSKGVRREALISALSQRLREGNVILVDAIPCEEIKTKRMAGQLAKWGFKKGLVVVDRADVKLSKSIRNIPNVTLTSASLLTTLDVIRHEKLLLTEEGVRGLEQRLL